MSSLLISFKYFENLLNKGCEVVLDGYIFFIYLLYLNIFFYLFSEFKLCCVIIIGKFKRNINFV